MCDAATDPADDKPRDKPAPSQNATPAAQSSAESPMGSLPGSPTPVVPEGASVADRSEGATGSCVGVSVDLVELVALHHAAVYRYAFRLTGSVADAEDLAQHAFLVAQQKFDQIREAELAGRWLLAVVRNAFLKNRRRRVPMPAGGLEIDLASVPQPVARELPFDAFPIDEDRLQAAIDELPEEFKVPLVMFYFEECSYRDIADQLDLPPGTVMSRLSRAKSHLRKRLFQDEVNPAAPSRNENRTDGVGNKPTPHPVNKSASGRRSESGANHERP